MDITSIHEHSIVMLENTLIAKNMFPTLCNTHTHTHTHTHAHYTTHTLHNPHTIHTTLYSHTPHTSPHT